MWVAEGIARIACHILHCCLSRFRVLSFIWLVQLQVQVQVQFQGELEIAIRCCCGMPNVSLGQPKFVAYASLYPCNCLKCWAINCCSTLCHSGFSLCPSLGGDCFSWVSSPFLDQVHACMVLNFGEFRSFCLGTFQCAENAPTYILRDGDGCCFCAIKEHVAIYAFA